VFLEAHDEQSRLEQGFRGRERGRERIATLRAEMHKTMEESAGIYRREAPLGQAATRLRELQGSFEHVALDDRSYTFNTELIAVLELSYMLDLAEAIVHSARERRESRGSHQRSDHPRRDDAGFLKHTLARRGEDGVPCIEYLPVTLTRWPPGERVYGR